MVLCVQSWNVYGVVPVDPSFNDFSKVMSVSSEFSQHECTEGLFLQVQTLIITGVSYYQRWFPLCRCWSFIRPIIHLFAEIAASSSDSTHLFQIAYSRGKEGNPM